jgi:hypothetical protein
MNSTVIENTQPLADSALNYFRFNGALSFTVLWVMSVIALVSFAISHWQLPALWVVLLLVLVWICLGIWMIAIYPKKKFNHTRWRFDELGLHIYQGVWWKKQYAVPRSRVQHIDVAQGPVQRKLNIASLILHTAGTSNASVTLTGIDYQQACNIRDQLLVQDQSDAV